MVEISGKRILALAIVLFTSTIHLLSAAAPFGPVKEAPVPKSPYLGVAYKFADTLLQKGRDTYGPQKSGLFLSALDRHTLKPLTNHPAPPPGIREGDRAGRLDGPLVGANPQHDQNLLRLLYVLRGLSGDTKYEKAADNELKWMLEKTRSSQTDLPAWGEHLSWDVMTDAPLSPRHDRIHEYYRPWLLWDRCFEVSPHASRLVALGLWNHQIANQTTGAFDRHTPYNQHGPRDGNDFPRHAGFYIRTWAVAYARTSDQQFLQAIETLLQRYQNHRDPKTGLIPSNHGSTVAWPPSNLSLAIDCSGAAHRVPEPLASQLRQFVDREDQTYLGLPHDFQNSHGFVAVIENTSPPSKPTLTGLWNARYGGYTTAQIGMMCVSRYDNSAKIGYRDLILAAADAYLESDPDPAGDAWPGTFGQAISLQLAAWRHTARQVYLDRARSLADWAVENFWEDHPLPRASLDSDHYETITGADTLALALVELHLQILAITAVPCPPNTADR